MFENLLNPILAPLLKLPPFAGILMIALLVTVLVTFIYKWTTDQDLMKRLKDEIKEFQNQTKTLKNEPQKAMAVQKKAMETNMKYMMHSFKPMLFTFIPIILIFGWLNGHIAYDPILPGTEFTTSLTFNNNVAGEVTLAIPEGIILISDATQTIAAGKAEWALKGDAGEYILEYNFNNKIYTKDLLITEERAYKTPIEKVKDSDLKTITIGNNALKPLGDISILGWRPGWLGTYIILSIVFSMVLRKILKIY